MIISFSSYYNQVHGIPFWDVVISGSNNTEMSDAEIHNMKSDVIEYINGVCPLKYRSNDCNEDTLKNFIVDCEQSELKNIVDKIKSVKPYNVSYRLSDDIVVMVINDTEIQLGKLVK